jgi:tetratricopeptide (TPR) repeat protein
MLDDDRMNEIIARHKKLLDQYPNNELARFSLGKAYFDIGDFAHAKEQFEWALTKRADWMVVHILLGRCELTLGNLETARQSFERARRLAIDQNHEGPLAEIEALLADLQ